MGLRLTSCDNTLSGRGTVIIDTEICKGCELCIEACPPRVLTMSSVVNRLGYQYPELQDGCTGCAACQLFCPDFVFEVFRRPRAPAPNKENQS
ncbi:MAG: 4Fe-4S dicluster domain-containing protein [Acidimicrobiia bacterium]|nr:4Fe-4S dicluster domain-containing protein [Acidimicrobiia bacterium]